MAVGAEYAAVLQEGEVGRVAPGGCRFRQAPGFTFVAKVVGPQLFMGVADAGKAGSLQKEFHS